MAGSDGLRTNLVAVRVVALVVVVLVGLALFIWLAARTPVVVTPPTP